jgi:teichoic acid transport system permease protein
VFSFYTSCLTDGSKSIVGSMGLLRTLHFPRVVLPLAKVLQNLMALGPTMLVLGLLMLVFKQPLTWSWLLVFPALGLMAFYCLGVAMIAARLTIHVRDITNLIPFVNRLTFYVSGIFFSVEKLAQGSPIIKAVLTYNPTHVYISLVRNGMLANKEGYNFTLMWIAGLVWAVIACIGGFVYFWRAEERYGRT